MERMVWIVAGLNFAVDLLLLAAIIKQSRQALCIWRTVLAATVGGACGALCLLPGFHFLGNIFWRMVCLCLMSLLAFGLEVGTVRNGALFSFLWLAMNGIAVGFSRDNIWTLLLWGALLMLLYLMGFGGGNGSMYLPVTIRYGGSTVRITALRDTGNFLIDPVSGQGVLIVDPSVAGKLLGLTANQLADPVGTLASARYPGLRLIPYRALGQPGGMLLAMRFADVVMGQEKGARVVAFAPNEIGTGGNFEALAGGMA